MVVLYSVLVSPRHQGTLGALGTIPLFLWIRREATRVAWLLGKAAPVTSKEFKYLQEKFLYISLESLVITSILENTNEIVYQTFQISISHYFLKRVNNQ